MALPFSVNDLLGKSVWKLTPGRKRKIVKRGKPRPTLENLKLKKSEKDSSRSNEQADKNTDKYLSNFDVELYDRVEWLTGCDIRVALFCWPCLLFKVNSCVWNTTGMQDLSEIHLKIVDHEKSKDHIQARLNLYLLTKKIVNKRVEKPMKTVDKELIARNCEIVKHLIDVICFLCSTQKKSRIKLHKNTLPIEDCLENVQFLSNFDLLQLNVIDDAITMVQMRHQIINDLVDTITSVMKMSILKEIQQSTFVSMIITEHSCTRSRSQISTVLRYLKRGEVCERFVGFTNMSSKLTPTNIVQHISKMITEFQISRRIVSYSLDGSVVTNASSLQEVKTQLQFNHPYIHFVPCHYHKLDTILQESLSMFPDCDLFFKNLMSLKSCLKEESSLWQVYQDFRIVNCTPSILCFNAFNSTNTAEFLNTVKTHRSSLITLFEFAVGKSEKLTASDFVQLTALKVYLNDVKTVQLLEMLIKLFDIIAPITEACNSPVPRLSFDSNLIDGILDSYSDYSELEFLWTQIMADSLQEMKKTMDATTAVENAKQISESMRKQFMKIGRSMIIHFKFRFESLKSTTFFQILNLETSAKFLDSEYVSSLNTTYGQSIQYVPLHNEIKLVVARNSFINIQSVHQWTKFFVVSNLFRTVPNLYRLCELFLTLPCTLPTEDYSGSSTKLCEMEPRQSGTWTYRSVKFETSGDPSLMCIERHLLEEIRQKKTFFDDVIAKFEENNNFLQLSYGKCK